MTKTKHGFNITTEENPLGIRVAHAFFSSKVTPFGFSDSCAASASLRPSLYTHCGYQSGLGPEAALSVPVEQTVSYSLCPQDPQAVLRVW